MIANTSDFAGDSSSFSGNDSIRTAFIDENICGEGATCIVYSMNLQGLHVVIKRLKEDFIDNPVHRAAFRKEYQIGQQLKHDSLPVYRELRDDLNEVYIVMDYIDGVSLSDFLSTDDGYRYFSSVTNMRRFLTELVSVVSYLHRKGVIHCDIKPDNIMLRHSDRGLMLIDLDKAYSDVLDKTSGGTSGFSDLLDLGEKPKVQKDFVAIGKVLDFIAEHTPNFPQRSFKHFRKECNRPDISSEKLLSALNPHSHKGLLIAVSIFTIFLLSGVLVYLSRNESPSGINGESQEFTIRESSDSFISNTTVIETPEIVLPTQHSQPAVKQIIISDFDSKMADFIQEAQRYLSDLSSATLTDRQIRDMMSKIVESYTSKYHIIQTDYKAAYAESDGIDIELAVARASEKSRASGLLQKFTLAASDTIKTRHPESYSEN